MYSQMKISSSNFLKLPKATKPSVYKDCDWKETKILLSFRCSKNLIIHDKSNSFTNSTSIEKGICLPNGKRLELLPFFKWIELAKPNIGQYEPSLQNLSSLKIFLLPPFQSLKDVGLFSTQSKSGYGALNSPSTAVLSCIK